MKNKRKSLIWQFLALIFFTLGTFTARAQNCTYVANIPPTGSLAINGLTVTSSSTGYAVAEGIASPLATCFGAGSYGLFGALRVGHNTATWGVDNAAWSTTLTFSKPVNDIVIFIAGTGSVNDAGHTNNEKFSFTSNGGAISITSTIKCASTISGNTITSGAGTNGISAGGGIFQLHAPAAFTTLTMSGLGGLDGSNIGLCRATLACIALSALKPPVKNLTNTCTATTVNLNNAHTGTVPAGTSLKWFTNNTHTGTALSGTQVTQAGAGTYYAFYNDITDPVNTCWSPASDPVTVTITDCCTLKENALTGSPFPTSGTTAPGWTIAGTNLPSFSTNGLSFPQNGSNSGNTTVSQTITGETVNTITLQGVWWYNNYIEANRTKTLTVSYAGVDYLSITTGAGSGTAPTITPLNGASVTGTLPSLTSGTNSSANKQDITIYLPSPVTTGGNLLMTAVSNNGPLVVDGISLTGVYVEVCATCQAGTTQVPLSGSTQSN